MQFSIGRTYNQGRVLLSLPHPTDKVLGYKWQGWRNGRRNDDFSYSTAKLAQPTLQRL